MVNLTPTSMVCVLIAFLVGCADSRPTHVYVPGPQATSVCTIRVSTTTARGGQTITLHAKRKTSGFVRVESATLPPDARWVTADPPALEPEVATSVRWLVEPEGAATFNLDSHRINQPRTVTFSKPGVYQIQASSASWMSQPIESNAIEITITK